MKKLHINETKLQKYKKNSIEMIRYIKQVIRITIKHMILKKLEDILEEKFITIIYHKMMHLKSK